MNSSGELHFTLSRLSSNDEFETETTQVVSGQAASCSASESDKGLVSQKAAGSRFCPLFCFAPRFSSQALKESDKD